MLDAIGVVVHPSRDVSGPLEVLEAWARGHGVTTGTRRSSARRSRSGCGRRRLVVTFGDEEPFLTGLRRRGIVADSPRVLARDRREGRAA